MTLERKRRYYEENREALLEQQRRYRKKNREVVLERGRRRREENREALLEYQRRYYEENREALLEEKRRYREENREALLEEKRRYREKISATMPPATERGAYTPAEDAFILTNWDMSIVEQAIVLGRSQGSVRGRRRSLRKKGLAA